MADGLWFEAHATMARHPKTLKLSRLLGVSRREAVGLLHDLFSWGLTSAQKYGELPGLTAEDIAAVLDFPHKQAMKVVGALVESGYLERHETGFMIHEWYDYAGKLYDSREKNKEKNQRYRDRKKTNQLPERDGHVTVTALSHDGATIPNRTLPDLPPPPIGADVCDEGLGLVMTAYLDRIDPTPSPTSMDKLKGYVMAMGAEVCLRAIEKALDAKVANWNYVHGILRSLESQGVRCLADLERIDAEHEGRTKNGITGTAPTTGYSTKAKQWDLEVINL